MARRSRRNPDVRLRRLERAAAAGDPQAAARLYVAMWRTPQPQNREWARKSVQLLEQAGHLLPPPSAEFQRVRHELRRVATDPKLGMTSRSKPGKEMWSTSGGATIEGIWQWLNDALGGAAHWKSMEDWGDPRYQAYWTSADILAEVGVTEGDLSIVLYASTDDWTEGMAASAKFYAQNPRRGKKRRPRRNPRGDEQRRRLERAAATGGPRAQLRFAMAKIKAGQGEPWDHFLAMDALLEQELPKHGPYRLRDRAFFPNGGHPIPSEQKIEHAFARALFWVDDGTTATSRPGAVVNVLIHRTKPRRRMAVRVDPLALPLSMSYAVALRKAMKKILRGQEFPKPQEWVKLHFRPLKGTRKPKRQNPWLAVMGNPRRAPGEITLAEARRRGGGRVVDKALARFREFHGAPAEGAYSLQTDDGKPGRTTKVVFAVGQVPETHYETNWGSNKDGYHWVHPWESPPLLTYDPELGVYVTIPAEGNSISDWLDG